MLATSLRTLLLFDAAARLGSFSRAANEVGVGQPAVSHAVRQLEDVLGARLFRRQHRGVALTEAGERLAERVAAGFLHIQQGLDEARSHAGTRGRVTLLVSTSLASYWLMPRVAQFKAAHPSIDLRCITQDTDRDVGAGDFDLCIPLGRGSWPGYRHWKFCDEEIFPVCSADFLTRAGTIGSPAELLQHPLLHLEERYASRCNWRKWLSHFGVTASRHLPGQTSNDYSIVLQSALEGQGLALGWRHIVQPLLDQRLLLRPIPQSVCSRDPFYILSPDQRVLSSEANILREWLIREAGGRSTSDGQPISESSISPEA